MKIGYSEGMCKGPFDQECVGFIVSELMLYLLPFVTLLDFAHSGKPLSRVAYGLVVVMWFSQDGKALLKTVLFELMSIDTRTRVICLAMVWLAVVFWWATCFRTRCCPAWYCLFACLLHVFVCSRLDINQTSTIVSVDGLLDKHECDAIVAAVEEHGRTFNWTNKRHATQLATEDIPLYDITGLDAMALHRKISGRLSSLRDFVGGDLHPQEAYVVRYRGNRQAFTGLMAHKDLGTHTYSIALSEPQDFEGGGVYFPALKDEESDEDYVGTTIRMSRGGLLLHDARLTHQAKEVESGTRYMLVFLNSVRPPSWQLYPSHWANYRGWFATEVLLQKLERCSEAGDGSEKLCEVPNIELPPPVPARSSEGGLETSTGVAGQLPANASCTNLLL
ncbi:unnamed protein product [Polarella glacialis]|uniref:Prolyl 4-hydroxylase alpha subunit domain-containing protein n=1 Tax=Polarella glacialis TaxID=89957 RepID=A0A813K652_POLGL|nr:unnamed protein product [Polarella glacialis]